jgi:hypothetical protein
MILQIYTIVHTLVSLVAIFTGFVVLFGLLAGNRLDAWDQMVSHHRSSDHRHNARSLLRCSRRKPSRLWRLCSTLQRTIRDNEIVL